MVLRAAPAADPVIPGPPSAVFPQHSRDSISAIPGAPAAAAQDRGGSAAGEAALQREAVLQREAALQREAVPSTGRAGYGWQCHPGLLS